MLIFTASLLLQAIPNSSDCALLNSIKRSTPSFPDTPTESKNIMSDHLSNFVYNEVDQFSLAVQLNRRIIICPSNLLSVSRNRGWTQPVQHLQMRCEDLCSLWEPLHPACDTEPVTAATLRLTDVLLPICQLEGGPYELHVSYLTIFSVYQLGMMWELLCKTMKQPCIDQYSLTTNNTLSVHHGQPFCRSVRGKQHR